MTSTYQTQLTDSTYNGWTNYSTWNVALWLQNDEGLYNLALDYKEHGYNALAEFLSEIIPSTPDGVSYTSSDLNICELNDMLEEL